MTGTQQYAINLWNSLTQVIMETWYFNLVQKEIGQVCGGKVHQSVLHSVDRHVGRDIASESKL